MKAAMYYGIKDVRVEDVRDPEAGPGELVIEVDAATTAAPTSRCTTEAT